jgi:uncharacterized protein YjbJ (UPF0337 family)
MSKVAAKHQQVIKDEADAEKRYVKGEAPETKGDATGDETRDAQDALRYQWLRDKVRKGDGTIDERLYVRCDGRNDGRWALDGRELDEVLDALIAAPVADLEPVAEAGPAWVTETPTEKLTEPKK